MVGIPDVAGVDPGTVAEVEREASALLSELIRIDTSNPPGNETRVAEHMAAWFGRHGLEGEVVGEPEDRRSFVLRVEGARPGPSLLLLAHEDVVPAVAADWQVPPFAGVVRDGYVWGRGALDIKNLVAAHAVATRRLAAAGDFAGTLVYACTADEEEGAVAGARWLVENRPDLVRCDYVLNEGGGGFLERDGRRLYLLENGEKGTAQFRIVVRGEGGHASVPRRDGNAVVAAARVVAALAAHETPVVVDEGSAALVRAMVPDPDLARRLRDPATARAALAELERRDPLAADLVTPLYGFGFAPTVLRSNTAAINVYPSQVEIGVDCRTPAGRDEREVEAEVRAALEGVEADWRLEWVSVVPGNASPPDTPLAASIRKVMARFVPGCEVVPAHSVGFTDSNWFRAAFPGTVAYNFCPFLVEDGSAVLPRFHSHDERIHVRDLAFQALVAEAVAREVLV